MLPTRTKFLSCLSTKAAAFLMILCFIILTTRLRHDTKLSTKWSVDDAPVAGMFMPLTRPGWKTGNPELDNTLHIVGSEARQAMVDIKGGDMELAPPETRPKI